MAAADRICGNEDRKWPITSGQHSAVCGPLRPFAVEALRAHVAPGQLRDRVLAAQAHDLGTATIEPPHRTIATWSQGTEILAVFLGFGLALAHTALVLPRDGSAQSILIGSPIVRVVCWNGNLTFVCLNQHSDSMSLMHGLSDIGGMFQALSHDSEWGAADSCRTKRAAKVRRISLDRARLR